MIDIYKYIKDQQQISVFVEIDTGNYSYLAATSHQYYPLGQFIGFYRMD